MAVSVVLGHKYRHRHTGTIMRVYAGSAPTENNRVELIDEDAYGKWNGFSRRWHGTWDEFLIQWEESY